MNSLNLRKQLLALVIAVFILIIFIIYNKRFYEAAEWDITSVDRIPTIKRFKLENVSTSEKKSNKYIIYNCKTFCGGFADRIGGILNLFIMAERSNRSFRIMEKSSCGITAFLMPSAVDWKVKPGELEGLSNRSYNDLYIHNFTKYLSHDVVYVRSRTLSPVVIKNSSIYKKLFNSLFVLRKDVKNEINRFRRNVVKDRKLICAHIRIGKSKHLTDTLYNNLGNISAIWKFFSKYDKDGYVFFIASDSIDILRYTRERFPRRIVNIKGKIRHIDKMRDDTKCTGMRKVLLDVYILSTCDILLLTESGFGHCASFLRDQNVGQFCFADEKIYSCPTYDLKRQRSKKQYKRFILF